MEEIRAVVLKKTCFDIKTSHSSVQLLGTLNFHVSVAKKQRKKRALQLCLKVSPNHLRLFGEESISRCSRTSWKKVI